MLISPRTMNGDGPLALLRSGWRKSRCTIKNAAENHSLRILGAHRLRRLDGLPADGLQGRYVDRMTSADTADVAFGGNSFSDSTTVLAMLLLRCSEFTLEHGYRYFVVTSIYDASRLSSFTTPGTATTNTYGNISGLGYGSNAAILVAQSDTTFTLPRTTNSYKPAVADWIKMPNSAIALEPYKPYKDFPIGDAAILAPLIWHDLGLIN